jgi:arylsulfatase
MQVGNVLGRIPGPENVFMSYGRHWANASNTPFRRYKCWTHEGGIATPFIVNLPGRARAGTVHRDPVHLTDLSPTILALAGAEYPEQHDGKAILPVEGESFAPLLSGERWARRREILWEHQDCRAVRAGEWKLVSGAGEKWELYDLNEDRTELNDLAASDKARVAEMAKRYDEWAKRCGVLTRAELSRLRKR